MNLSNSLTKDSNIFVLVYCFLMHSMAEVWHARVKVSALSPGGGNSRFLVRKHSKFVFHLLQFHNSTTSPTIDIKRIPFRETSDHKTSRCADRLEFKTNPMGNQKQIAHNEMVDFPADPIPGAKNCFPIS